MPNNDPERLCSLGPVSSWREGISARTLQGCRVTLSTLGRSGTVFVKFDFPLPPQSVLNSYSVALKRSLEKARPKTNNREDTARDGKGSEGIHPETCLQSHPAQAPEARTRMQPLGPQWSV